ncbi:phenylacetate--CoA ligase family protein [Dethiobacter alkaliphilus]|uniref:phenylacetate--CoA ligase family protein n=1 Tax=Dethiobacter alkaliphilus TaxID=427926 RepID=UPI002225DE1E|nr:phenylacetate--CoA ligase [Dethiobacter alkaliphilus]MCW3488707.1 phenylacetate--CoA ligase [Dethiobacter alkaliphilus]
MVWDAAKEMMDKEEMRREQLPLLQQTIRNVYENVPFYRELFDREGVHPDDLQTLEDVQKFPFTTKDALRDNYPYGLFARPMKDIVRLHASSGTTGKPIVVGYTQNDIDMWSNLIARLATMAGVSQDDVAQICFSYGLFTGGFGLHYGLEKAGATVVPASVGNTEKQIMLIQDFDVNVLVCTPTYALYLSEVANDMGLDPRKLSLRVGMFGGEPWTENMRTQIEERLGIVATDNYGLSEIVGPGVAGECQARAGLHINEDHFLVEVIDPETGEVLPDGEEGELVFTSLTKEAFPIIRYRTKDISVLNREACSCGRTGARMRKVTGRTDDMLIIGGVNVFPSQIESVLMEIPEVAPHYLIVVDKKKAFLDDLEVHVELNREKFTGSFRDLEAVEKKISRKLANVLTVSPRVKLVEPKSLERSTGKAKRVLDKRKTV